jgi:hypothetical protein
MSGFKKDFIIFYTICKVRIRFQGQISILFRLFLTVKEGGRFYKSGSRVKGFYKV